LNQVFVRLTVMPMRFAGRPFWISEGRFSEFGDAGEEAGSNIHGPALVPPPCPELRSPFPPCKYRLS